MRQKARILGITLALIGASIALEAILVSAYPQGVDVKKGTDAINKFLECINTKIEEKKNTGGINISDTVACLPGSCTVTATMSEDSAQEACFSVDKNCQLPRVILKCPESSKSPQIEFSYLLCGTGSEPRRGGEIGSNRVEVGAVAGEINLKKVMVMADIPVPPGTTTEIKDVISLFPPGTDKGCNSSKCHKSGNPGAGAGTPRLSERIEVFGTSGTPTTARNPSFIIFTDDCEVANKVKNIPLNKGLEPRKEKFSEICDCIKTIPMGTYTTKKANGEVGTVTAAQAGVVLKLCQELENYQKTRGIKGGATAVTLAYFTAEAGDDGVVTLLWETATEVDNAGFNIYRARLKDGIYKKINDTLIPAQGDAVSGASYSYIDTPGNGTFYYKLEDVDYYGVSTIHGPEKVRVRSGNNASRRSR